MFGTRVSILVIIFLLLASCATAPPPAESPAKERAASLVTSGADAGQATPVPPPPSAAAAAATAPEPPLAPEPAPAVAVVPSPSPAPVTEEALPTPPPPGQLSTEEAAFLQNYLNRLNYMVYYREGAEIDPRIAKIAVSQANRYLIEKSGLSVVDYDQIEQNKKDQASAWQAETGGSIGIVQYIAQKFNADVYLEIDFAVSSEQKDGKYYATAQGSMKIYETSTATLLGSVAFMSQPAFSPSSLAAAASNAVSATVWNLMPKVTGQAKELVRNSLSRGIRFEVLIQRTPDARLIGAFRRALAKKVREVEQVSYSADSTNLNVWSFVSKDKIEDAVYGAAAIAGLRDLSLVYMRGRSFTFNSGL